MHFRPWWRWSFFPQMYSQQMLRYNTTCWTNYRFSSRFGEDSKAGMKLRTFSSGWGGWLGLLSGTSLGCNWFIYRMRNTWINLLEKEANASSCSDSGGKKYKCTNKWRIDVHTLAALKSSSRTSDNVGCAWTANLMSCGMETIMSWYKLIAGSSIHDVIRQRKMLGYNKNKLSKTLTWTRVPRAMAFDASWMRSAACKPKMWTPRISPVSDR